MSRAFVKESDGAAADRDLPELRISEHRNLVTSRGLVLIEDAVRRLEDELSTARAAGDTAAAARHARDLRYWTARRTSAQVVPLPADDGKARFGSTVTVRRPDGSEVTYRIVGEDEAAPAAGSISYVSPRAVALLGHEPGDTVRFGDDEVEILAIQA